MYANVERRKQETHLNSFPQYQADIVDDDGKTYTVHFAALFSQRRDAVPMARLTGWPCSFAESLPLLEILRGKYQPKELPYHFILPSQPGWPFSSAPPTDRDWTYADSARILHKLMTVALGLKSYALSGGDIGAGIARIMASQFREVQVLHTNYVQMPQPDEGPDVEMLQAYEREGVYRGQTFMATGTAYGRMQGTRPSTLAAVLSSSPLALLAWIGEKYLEWSDPAIVVPVDHILTTVCLYWFTGACATTFYPYREDYLVGVALGNEKAAKKGYLHGQKDLRVDKPFGYSDFPQEPVPCPKPWAEKSGRLVWYRRHQQGGHFPDLERSEALLEDLEDFLSKVWETDVCVDSWCCRDSASPIV